MKNIEANNFWEKIMIRHLQGTHYPLCRLYSFYGFPWPRVLQATPTFMRRMCFRNSEFRLQLSQDLMHSQSYFFLCILIYSH